MGCSTPSLAYQREGMLPQLWLWDLWGRRLLVRPNKFKFIVVAYVRHNQIEGGTLKRLVTGSKFLQQVIVARI
jgi:hypothetical protein